jgi:hypothetical protein
MSLEAIRVRKQEELAELVAAGAAMDTDRENNNVTIVGADTENTAYTSDKSSDDTDTSDDSENTAKTDTIASTTTDTATTDKDDAADAAAVTTVATNVAQNPKFVEPKDDEVQKLKDKLVKQADVVTPVQAVTKKEVDRVKAGPTPEELAAIKRAEAEAKAEAARQARKAELAARREAMKQAWLHDDLSKITNADDLKKAKGKWSDREGTFSSSGPMRIAGEEPNLIKYMKGQRINQDTGKWEQKKPVASKWKDPNKDVEGGRD